MKACAILAAVVFAGVAAAAPAQRAEPQPLASELPALQLLSGIRSESSPTDRLAALAAALTMLPQPTPLRGLILCEHATMLGVLGRHEEERQELAQCLQLRPNDARVLLALGFAEAANQRAIDGAQLVTRAVALSPETANQNLPSTMDGLMRQLRYVRAYAVADRLTEALANGGWARGNPIAFSKMAAEAMRYRLVRRDVAGSLSLLPSILSPQVGVNMLLDRDFESIWPQVESWAGSDLSVQRRALLTGSRAAFERTQKPSDRIAYVEALELTGFPAAAIAELEMWTSANPPERDLFFHNMATVRLGKLLGESERRAEAITIMTAALTGPGSHDRSVSNIVPNLVVQMLMANANQRALAVLDRYTPAEEGVEAPAALGYFLALRICASAGLGKHLVTDEAILRMQTVYASNNRAVELAINCAASEDARAAYWISQVQNEESRAEALMALAGAIERTRRGMPIRSLNEPTLRAVANRPDVRATYNRFGRELPESYRSALVNFDGAATMLP